jgi:hypothetical protein
LEREAVAEEEDEGAMKDGMMGRQDGFGIFSLHSAVSVAAGGAFVFLWFLASSLSCGGRGCEGLGGICVATIGVREVVCFRGLVIVAEVMMLVVALMLGIMDPVGKVLRVVEFLPFTVVVGLGVVGVGAAVVGAVVETLVMDEEKDKEKDEEREGAGL